MFSLGKVSDKFPDADKLLEILDSREPLDDIAIHLKRCTTVAKAIENSSLPSKYSVPNLKNAMARVMCSIAKNQPIMFPDAFPIQLPVVHMLECIKVPQVSKAALAMCEPSKSYKDDISIIVESAYETAWETFRRGLWYSTGNPRTHEIRQVALVWCRQHLKVCRHASYRQVASTLLGNTEEWYAGEAVEWLEDAIQENLRERDVENKVYREIYLKMSKCPHHYSEVHDFECDFNPDILAEDFKHYMATYEDVIDRFRSVQQSIKQSKSSDGFVQRPLIAPGPQRLSQPFSMCECHRRIYLRSPLDWKLVRA